MSNGHATILSDREQTDDGFVFSSQDSLREGELVPEGVAAAGGNGSIHESDLKGTGYFFLH